jgi:hypothetical protein
MEKQFSKETLMKFMVLMIPGVFRGNKKLDNFVPPAEAMERMGKFNQEMLQAGLLKDGTGLHPLSQGARITFSSGKPVVTDGASVQAQEVLGGFWMLEAPSKEKVIEWMKKCPADKDDILEVREVFG